MARTTQQDNAALIAALMQVVVFLGGDESAKPKKAAPKAKVSKPKREYCAVATEDFEFSGKRVGKGSRKLTHSNRKAFIAAHAWAHPGMSTLTLRHLVQHGAKVNAAWSVAI